MTEWTIEEVAERLEEAASVLRRLPEARVRGHRNGWPAMLVEFADLVGREPEPLRPRSCAVRSLPPAPSPPACSLLGEREEEEVVAVAAAAVGVDDTMSARPSAASRTSSTRSRPPLVPATCDRYVSSSGSRPRIGAGRTSGFRLSSSFSTLWVSLL